MSMTMTMTPIPSSHSVFVSFSLISLGTAPKKARKNKSITIQLAYGLKKFQHFVLFHQEPEPEPAPGRKFPEPEPPQNRPAPKPCYTVHANFFVYYIQYMYLCTVHTIQFILYTVHPIQFELHCQNTF